MEPTCVLSIESTDWSIQRKKSEWYLREQLKTLRKLTTSYTSHSKFDPCVIHPVFVILLAACWSSKMCVLSLHGVESLQICLVLHLRILNCFAFFHTFFKKAFGWSLSLVNSYFRVNTCCTKNKTVAYEIIVFGVFRKEAKRQCTTFHWHEQPHVTSGEDGRGRMRVAQFCNGLGTGWQCLIGGAMMTDSKEHKWVCKEMDRKCRPIRCRDGASRILRFVWVLGGCKDSGARQRTSG